MKLPTSSYCVHTRCRPSLEGEWIDDQRECIKPTVTMIGTKKLPEGLAYLPALKLSEHKAPQLQEECNTKYEQRSIL